MGKMLRIVILVLWVFGFCPVLAQEGTPPRQVVENGKTYILHPVKPGETLYSIGQQYGVEVVLILNNNPQLLSGLRSGDTLRIPVVSQEQLSPVADAARMPDRLLSHHVQRRETLYSISRRYDITMDDILNFNPGLGQLRRGETIRIPQWNKVQPGQAVQSDAVPTDQGIHIVVAGETYFAISRKYSTTVQLLQDLNPGVTALRPGMQIRVPVVTGDTPREVYMPSTASEAYIEHTIVSGETLFSLTRKYNVAAERLVELNPALDGAFRTGTVIRIPVQPEPVESDNYMRHVVQQGETVYRLSQVYRVSVDELMKWNPYLSYRNLIPGDTIRFIPGLFEAGTDSVDHGTSLVISAECDQTGNNAFYRPNVQVVMLLPLMADANLSANRGRLTTESIGNEEYFVSPDSVHIIRGDRGSQIRFQGNSENFVHFYEGALLAIDSLRKSGVKVDLQVYDTENREAKVRQLIATDKLKNADLIIGPVYPNEQKEVAEYAMRNQIPMVSPLAATAEFSKGNPWFFQVNTPREIINEVTADYVASNYRKSNFIVLKTGRQTTDVEMELINQIRDKVLKNGLGAENFRTCDFQKSGLVGLREMVRRGQKNIILLSSGNEADVSVGISNIHTLVPGYDITVIGHSRLHQFESINQEYFHDGQLEFLAPYWPEYGSPVARSFVRKFRDYFKTEPNQFSMQGYDVTFFFAKAASDFGHDFRSCVHMVKPELIQGNYRFEKNPSGGYVNMGLQVVTFTRDYRVVAREVFQDN